MSIIIGKLEFTMWAKHHLFSGRVRIDADIRAHSVRMNTLGLEKMSALMWTFRAFRPFSIQMFAFKWTFF
jgi:hypothetical protein